MKILKTTAIILTISSVLVGAFSLLKWSIRQKQFEDWLPAKLEFVGSITTADGNGIPFGCFFGVYKLSDKTLAGINRDKLKFFEDATKARAYKQYDYNMYNSYQKWQKTPIEYTNNNRTFGAGIECARSEGLDESLAKKIELAAFSEGSFYTGHPEGQLLVIPDLGIAVLSGVGD
ncbi:hypothetical protein Syn7502_01888 [Synechococcus sp. PCC 7502]|uniref:hypothetical protein n=1 Tax=Synechococcus sp. PCC 7502 TaxID=1173263 RepID=UPI00029FF2D7|nr:hypothetical protein [Synechococcus sp. PCC 7502]AFY73921.1 hypothetical protein Syn7502_01888 [Synechococcus sp. PCC 7502]